MCALVSGVQTCSLEIGRPNRFEIQRRVSLQPRIKAHRETDAEFLAIFCTFVPQYVGVLIYKRSPHASCQYSFNCQTLSIWLARKYVGNGTCGLQIRRSLSSTLRTRCNSAGRCNPVPGGGAVASRPACGVPEPHNGKASWREIGGT